MNVIFFTFIYLTFAPKKILSIDVLNKYSSIKISCSQKQILFDSKDFSLNEEMYFTLSIKTSGLGENLYYNFYNELDINNSTEISSLSATKYKTPESTSKSTTKKKKKKTVKSQIHYYTIGKEEESNYLFLKFSCPDKETITIENTKEDKGKQNKTIKIIAIVALVVIIIIIVIVVIIKRKKAQAARATQAAQATMYMGGQSYYPQPGMDVVPSGMMSNIPPPVAYPPPGGYPPPSSAVYSRMNNYPTNIAPNNQNNIVPIKPKKRRKKNQF